MLPIVVLVVFETGQRIVVLVVFETAVNAASVGKIFLRKKCCILCQKVAKRV